MSQHRKSPRFPSSDIDKAPGSKSAAAGGRRQATASQRSFTFDPRQILSGRRVPSRLTLSVAGSTVVAAGLAVGLAIGWPVSATAEQASLVAHRAVPAAGVSEPLGAVAPSAPPELAAASAAGAGQHVILVAREVAARRLAQQRAAARQLAEEQQAAEQQAAAQQQASSQAASGSPQQIALDMLGQFGWSDDQFSCLNSLWTEESDWNVEASNPASGAYGIPQALPGSKMASAGPDWETDATTQITWGLEYIQETYGSPCAAWDHEEADGWY